MKGEKGFTLVELLLVVTIIGILAAIAVPSYLGMQSRARMSEGRMLAGDTRKDILEFYWHTGRFPEDNKEAGLPDAKYLKGAFVESITVKDGAIFVKHYAEESMEKKDFSLHPAVPRDDPSAPVRWVGCDEEETDLVIYGCEKSGT